MRSKWLITLLFSLAAIAARAQSVGLVLSGGGAKGLYHIGVIQALEEQGIPIDYVSGTSMGAIIGGMYAAGYTPREMEAEFASGRVQQWLTGRIESRYQYYFKQMHRDASMITLRFGAQRAAVTGQRRRGGLLPGSLIPSNQLDLGFVEYFSPASAACEGDFDRLFVPFRCVATDATHQREAVFRSGDLGEAVRASMSIPMLFRPMVIDSVQFFDGGLFNNFPWQPLQEDFAPDILIGSRCVEDKEPRDVSMMEQLLVLTMMHTDYRLPRQSDISIAHVFTDVSTMDFGKAAGVIEAGYRDAMEMMPRIREQIARRVDPLELQTRREAFVARRPPLRFEDYRIEGLTHKQTDYVHDLLALGSRKQRPPYTLDQFRNEYFKILSEGQIDGNYPQVDYDPENGHYHLGMRMRTKPSFVLKVGGNISSTALNQAYIGMEYRAIRRSAHTLRLEGYFSPFYVSTQASVRTDFFLRIPLFWEVGASYNYYNYFRSDYGMVSKASDLTYGKYEDPYARAVIGTPLGRHSVFTLQANGATGAYRYSQSTKVYERGDELDRTRFDFFGAKVEARRDDLNQLLYPTRGIRQSLSGIYITGSERFRPGTTAELGGQPVSVDHRHWFGAKFSREHYFPIRPVRWFSWGYLMEAVLSDHPSLANDYATNVTMPAFTPTPHSRIVYMREFRASSYAALGITPVFEFAPNCYLRTSAYAFLPGGIEMKQIGVRQRMRYMFDASLVYQTLVGPVSLSLSKYDAKGNNNFFVTFNFGLAIFNSKALFY